MSIQQTASLFHWNYFLALEQDLERLARFVEFNEDNFAAYSIEIAHLYLAAASEVDVVAKQLCHIVDVNASPKNIEEYREVLTPFLQGMANSAVTIPRYGLTLTPWNNWGNNKIPGWWSDHNKVKHQRDANFNRANLKNVLNAMAGLFLFNLYYYRSSQTKAIDPPPSLFTPPNSLAVIASAISGGVRLYFTPLNQ